MNLNPAQSKLELELKLKSLEELKNTKGTYEYFYQCSNCFTTLWSKWETTKNAITFSIQGMSNNACQIILPTLS